MAVGGPPSLILSRVPEAGAAGPEQGMAVGGPPSLILSRVPEAPETGARNDPTYGRNTGETWENPNICESYLRATRRCERAFVDATEPVFTWGIAYGAPRGYLPRNVATPACSP